MGLDEQENVNHSLAYTKMQRSKEVLFSEGGIELLLKQGCVSRVEEVIWKVAILLSKHLVAIRESIKGKRVVELGSGIGLVGIVAAALGATESVITDVDDVLPLIENNIQINQQQNSAKAACLWWGNDSDMKAVTADQPPIDFLLAADVVYMQVAEDLINLAATFDNLASDTTQILLAYEHRGDWVDNLIFFEEMERLNFNVSQQSLEKYSDTPSDEYILYTFIRNSTTKKATTLAVTDTDGDVWNLRKDDIGEKRLFLLLNDDRRPATTSLVVFKDQSLIAFLPAVVSSTRVAMFSSNTFDDILEFATSHNIEIINKKLPTVGQEVKLSCDIEGDDFEVKEQSGVSATVVSVTAEGQLEVSISDKSYDLWIDSVDY